MIYTKQNVTIVSILITLFILGIVQISNLFFQNLMFQESKSQISNQITNSSNQIPETKKEIKNQTNQTVTNKVQNQTTKKNTTVTNKVTKTVQVMQNEWKVVIPSIGLEAKIAEGTSSEVMDQYVGHFENTSKWNGNIALAAHNRGYPVNYFANLKKMKKGEIIEYYWNGEKRKYQVETITKIQDTDWTYLANTRDNRITLITCVENEPAYRRCVQAIEI